MSAALASSAASESEVGEPLVSDISVEASSRRALDPRTPEQAAADEEAFDVSDAAESLMELFSRAHPDASPDEHGLIATAFALAAEAHSGQYRRSGAPYLSHPSAVADLVTELGLDSASIAAALCHDVVEDTEVTLVELEARLLVAATPELARTTCHLVDGLTKIDRVKARSASSAQAANLRKLLVALAADPRVLVVKLCDRLHNCRTLSSLPEEKRRRIAQETLDVYAPLAHRLGMSELKWQLEDCSFRALHPERCQELEEMLAARAPAREAYLTAAVSQVEAALEIAAIPAEVTGRAKHLWSIYEKMVVRKKPFDEIHDLLGIRVVVEEVRDCYAALGALHSLWTPVPGRFKDYIAMPKFNLYQALHITSIGPQGRPVEVQIRTRDMDERAEYGVAAHWRYKDHRRAAGSDEPVWLSRLLEWNAEADDPEVFLEGLREDLAAGEVWVLTPQGDVVSLPAGATALDFAYSIHTEVGHRAVGTRVNGKLVALGTQLHSGDRVEVITSKAEDAGPKPDWLGLVSTPRARARIRSYLTRIRQSDTLEHGRAELDRALALAGMARTKNLGHRALAHVAKDLHLADTEALLRAVGEGGVAARDVVAALRGRNQQPEEAGHLPALVGRGGVLPVPARADHADQLHVEGLDDVLVRIAQCCLPVMGDEVLGYVTQGRGVSVHRTDCTNAASLRQQRERTVEVEWTQPSGGVCATIEIEALDRPKLLGDVALVLAECGVNILSCKTSTDAEQVARQQFEFELGGLTHLGSILAAVGQVDGVYQVRRLVG